MASEIKAHSCMICGVTGHKASKCIELHIPRLNEFYKPAGRGDNDDTDDNINIGILHYNKMRYNILKANTTARLYIANRNILGKSKRISLP